MTRRIPARYQHQSHGDRRHAKRFIARFNRSLPPGIRAANRAAREIDRAFQELAAAAAKAAKYLQHINSYQ